MSQAPGLSGTPDSGQRSSAATSASCAKSSASPTSPTMRAKLAISRADSIRQTASTVARVSRTIRLLLARYLRPQPFLLRPQLGRELGSEIVGLEHLPDLDLRLLTRERIGRVLDPLDRLFQRLHFQHPEAGQQLLRLGKWTVDDGAL